MDRRQLKLSVSIKEFNVAGGSLWVAGGSPALERYMETRLYLSSIRNGLS